MAAGVVGFFANRKAKEVEDTVKNAVEGLSKEGLPVLPAGTGITVPCRVTGYWPYYAAASGKGVQMEGGLHDTMERSLYTLENFYAGKAPYVSVSGDWKIIPYGQRISLSGWPGVVFRVHDTGSHFWGAGKLFRVVGREPFDVCVASPSTSVVALQEVTFYPDDHWASKGKKSGAKTVQLDKLGKPQVGCCGLDLLGAEDA